MMAIHLSTTFQTDILVRVLQIFCPLNVPRSRQFEVNLLSFFSVGAEPGTVSRLSRVSR